MPRGYSKQVQWCHTQIVCDISNGTVAVCLEANFRCCRDNFFWVSHNKERLLKKLYSIVRNQFWTQNTFVFHVTHKKKLSWQTVQKHLLHHNFFICKRISTPRHAIDSWWYVWLYKWLQRLYTIFYNIILNYILFFSVWLMTFKSPIKIREIPNKSYHVSFHQLGY